ncbi:primosome assembly protein PriA [Caballeronia temeraria]|uniref:Primosome assembly protein PriA n=1 Tax=Caballeronia temeraria TaxID=1777137 RepID=A0A158BY29_9BURK|nr:DEAD/DEAH box helicase family protein [Caballeronia temeraria]SAK75014.1 primosome assembly protein PriA [Caballeronia temeraria]
MTTFADLQLKQAYHKPEDDIARAFYLPCMAAAITYDRAVGYFSSAIYALAWPSLRAFVDSGGKIRLICSPVLTSDDVSAMAEGYAARDDEAQGRLLREEFNRLLATPGTVKPAKVLASLVALNVVDICVAWVGDIAGGKPRRLFHDKLGIFEDTSGNAVAFKGSMNETWPGLALDGNLESVDVFLSWAGEREQARVADEQSYFVRLWKNQFPGVTTVPLPAVARDALVAASDPEHWRELVDEICVEIRAAAGWSPEAKPNGRVPRPHQIAALDAWKSRGRRGIFEHATGSGKTFTALCAIKDSFSKGEVVVVLVPSDLLLRQWATELRATFGSLGLRLLVCGGGHSDWKKDGRLRSWTRSGSGAPRLVLATIQTASSPDFVQACRGGSHLFVVADEVHRLGAPEARMFLEVDTGARLGLSATPIRSGDPIGTAAIFDYFEGVVPPPFTLTDAIKAGTLTPYSYNIQRVRLEADEQQDWNGLTNEIRKIVARSMSMKGADADVESRLKMLLIRRARIIKSAKQKPPAAVSIVKSAYKRGQHWIVYCDDQVQLAAVRDALRSAGCTDIFEYHSAMTGDPRRTLDLFEAQGGIVVSIRCLDEGVDIPAVSHALILASSKNPREFIQRRGRVLRKSSMKSVSHVYDVLVTPLFDPDVPPALAILEGELARAIEFGTHAINPGCITDLHRLAIDHGIDWTKIIDVGTEDDDDNKEFHD